MNFQAKAIADLVEMFGWKYIGLVFSSDVLYGGEGSQSFNREAEARSFCLPIRESFSATDESKITVIIRKLVADTRIGAIVLFALLEDTVSLLSAMADANITDRVIIGSDDWINRLDYTDLPGKVRKLFKENRISLIGLSPRPLNSMFALSWIKNISRVSANTRVAEGAVKRRPVSSSVS